MQAFEWLAHCANFDVISTGLMIIWHSSLATIRLICIPKTLPYAEWNVHMYTKAAVHHKYSAYFNYNYPSDHFTGKG